MFLLTLFFLSYFLKILDLKGSIFAFIIGFTVSYLGSLYFLILLIIFVALSFIATKYKHSKKENIKGFENTRSWKSVLSKGVIPFILVFLPVNFIYKEVIFSVAVAAATSDTISGEFGVLSQNAYYITNLKKARPGENGAVSPIGEIWALIGSLIIAIFSLIFFDISIYGFLLILVFGFLGSQFDSTLGSFFENKGKIKKFTVNLVAIGLSIVFAYVCLL
ncbi:MAG: DUF92 domain-containing protein [Thermoplasmata archaeon]